MSKTPVTPDGLRQYDHLHPAMAVALAWDREGRMPWVHWRMKRMVRRQMPLLGRALDRLAREVNHR